MAPYSSTLAWKIPWAEEPGRLQSMGSRRVRHDWATSLSLFTFMHWRRKWQPTPVFLPGESQGRGSLVGCRLWVAQSQTWLKRLSRSSSSSRTSRQPTFLTHFSTHHFCSVPSGCQTESSSQSFTSSDLLAFMHMDTSAWNTHLPFIHTAHWYLF